MPIQLATHLDLVIRRATPADISFMVHLQKTNSDAIGFVSRLALREHVDYAHVLVALERGQHAAFLLHGAYHRTHVKIFQACVEYDLRRFHIGWSLVKQLGQEASPHSASLYCEVRDTLPARNFWLACGFRLTGGHPGGKRRASWIDHWKLRLPLPADMINPALLII